MSTVLGGIELVVKRLLAARSAVGGRYDPSTGCIYYLSDVSGVFLPWRYCPGRGHDMVLPWDRRVGELRVSEDGLLAFTSDFDGDERWAIYVYDGSRVVRVAGEDGSMNLLGAWSGSRLAFTGNARNGVDFDVYVYEDGRARMVYRGEGINIVRGWMGGRILVVKRNSNLDSDILLVDPVTGEARNLTRHEGEAANENPAPLDDRRLLYISNAEREYKALFILDIASGERRILFEPEGDVESVVFNGREIVVSVNERGSSTLYVLTASNGFMVRGVHHAKWVVSDLDPMPTGAVVSASCAREGSEVYIATATRVERITRSPKMGVEENLVEPVDFEYESFDGLRIHGLLYEPRGTPQPYPAVVWLHGGPESQARPSFHPLIQALVSTGLAVVAPNFRGSTGYGKTFVHLDDVEKRLDAVRDVYHAVEALSSRGLIDRERLCVMGASYGGYLTLMSLALYPELWKCGVEMVGIVNLVTFIQNTSPYRRRYRIAEYGDPEKHHEIMLRLSPITYVDRIRAPLMIVHGARDPRVPVSEAEQLVEALRKRGVNIRYIRLEDEGHGVTKIWNRVRVYTEAVEFILENLGLKKERDEGAA